MYVRVYVYACICKYVNMCVVDIREWWPCPFGLYRSCGGVFGNGVCDKRCHIAQCQFDGGDCGSEG